MSRYLVHLFAIAVAGLTMLAAPGIGAEEAVDLTLPENGGPTPPQLLPWTGLQGADGPRALIDDFNRADGPLGADWTDQAATFQIVSQAARGGLLALATHNTATGDTLEMDIAVDGSGSLQFVAAVLNYGGGVSNIFIKVQAQSDTQFNWGGCYIANNTNGFGLGFFSLDEPFASAHMAVSVDSSRTVTIDFTNVNGGTLSDQQYVCTGAPAAEGPALGMGAYNNLASIDNFADGPIPVELMRFTVE
jgi:hypothetical protein